MSATPPAAATTSMRRLIARHLGKHIPGNPTVVAQNMPGAGSMKAANYVYQVAPKDGTALGVIVESAALEQVLGNTAAQYDAAQVHLCRPRRHLEQHLHAVAHLQGADDRGRAEDGDDHRRHRPGLDRRDGAAAAQCDHRNEVQADQRLPGLDRSDAGDGARRGRRRELVMGGGESRQAGMATREEDPDLSCRASPSVIRTCPMRRASPNTATRRRTGRSPRSMPAAAAWAEACSARPAFPPIG